MERWKEYPREPKYEVSDTGEVRRKSTKHLLPQYQQKSGYMAVCITNSYRCPQWILVHRMVAETFIEGRRPGLVVDHINTDRSDNRVTNLRWATYKENSNNEQTKINRKNAIKTERYEPKTPIPNLSSWNPKPIRKTSCVNPRAVVLSEAM